MEAVPRWAGSNWAPGQDDLHHVPLLLHGSAQSGDHIAQAAHLADGRHLHCHMHHVQPWRLQLQHTARRRALLTLLLSCPHPTIWYPGSTWAGMAS